jgi:hypothetical protein
MKATSIGALLILLLGMGGLAISCWLSVEDWEENEARLSELEALRMRCFSIQRQALFPPESRIRARSCQADYLHHVVESHPLLRDEAVRAEELLQDPLFAHLAAAQHLRSRYLLHPNTLHFTARPSQSGSTFRDRQFQLTHPTEVDLQDVGHLLGLLEGAPSNLEGPQACRPLLFLTDFRLERKDQDGRWILDLALLEREWKAASGPTASTLNP